MWWGMWWLVLSAGLALGLGLGLPLARREEGSLVRLAAGANISWGVTTLLLFAPGGCLLLLLGADEERYPFVLAPIVLSGFVLGWQLVRSSRALLRDETAGLTGIVGWSVVHHVAVAAFFGIGGMPPLLGEGPETFWGPAAPAGIGLALAWLLELARRRTRATDAA